METRARPEQDRWAGWAKESKSKEGDGEKPWIWKKYMLISPRSTKKGEHRPSSSSYRGAAHLGCLLSSFLFIDKSKYFPGRLLSRMIWTAAAAVSTSANWGQRQKNGNYLGKEISFSPFPSGSPSLFISLQILLSHLLCFAAFLKNCFEKRKKHLFCVRLDGLMLSVCASLSFCLFAPSVTPLLSWLADWNSTAAWLTYAPVIN